jgi:hypothetical protein
VQHLSKWVVRDPLRATGLVESAKPLVLAVKGPAASSPASVREAILYGLSVFFTGDPYAISNAESLVAYLENLAGVITLLALPAADSEAALQAAIVGLLALVESIPRGDILRRMVFAVNLEDPRLVERELVAEWDLGRFTRSYTVEVGPLSPVTWNDARVWHAEHEVESRTGVAEDEVRKLFSEGEALRLRQFETRLQPLLTGR